jgi:hypothetical protein
MFRKRNDRPQLQVGDEVRGHTARGHPIWGRVVENGPFQIVIEQEDNTGQLIIKWYDYEFANDANVIRIQKHHPRKNVYPKGQRHSILGHKLCNTRSGKKGQD